MSGFFVGTRPGRTVTHGCATFDLPVLYYRDDLFGLLFTADGDAVRSLMPSEQLHPVMVPGRAQRGCVGLLAYNYFDTSIGPYGEVGVAIPVVHGPKPPPPLWPALLEARYPGFGYLVLHLPVTSTEARDAGRGEWGYTKFVADMDFTETPEYSQCDLSDEADEILTLRVAKGGWPMSDSRPLVTYTVKEGDLIKTTIPQQGLCCTRIRPDGCALELGHHEVSESIRQLGLSPRPLISRRYVTRSGILPSGEMVERGVGPLDGYLGTDRTGNHRTRYLPGDE